MKMHGPDQDVILSREDDSGAVLGQITLSQLYDIIHKRLLYTRILVSARNTPEPLENHVDIDAIAQNCMVELRRKLGLF